MVINSLTPRADLSDFPKVQKQHFHLDELLKELNSKNLPAQLIESINFEIQQINHAPVSGLKQGLQKTQTKILKLVEKESKLVPKNYYKNIWLALGMTAFGLPMGVAIGFALGNIAFLGIGLPFGLVMGMAAGISMDKKAEKEGRQLNWEGKVF